MAGLRSNDGPGDRNGSGQSAEPPARGRPEWVEAEDGRGSPRRDRGQVILLAAFSLAVAFVALAVIINSAIYTQNLATRGEAAGSTGALQYREQVEQTVGELLERANANYSTEAETTNSVKKSVKRLDEVLSYQQAQSGRVVNVSYLDETNGTRIYNGTGDFSNETGARDWTVAQSVNGTRMFKINITDTNKLDPLSSQPFVINLTEDGSSDEWILKVGTTDSGNKVTVKSISPSDVGTCKEPTPSDHVITINVTAGQFAGKPCAALDYGEGISGTYDIVYNNTGNVYGRYSLIVDQPSTTKVGAVGNETALYSVTVQYTYRTSRLVYRTNIRVAPGEPDE